MLGNPTSSGPWGHKLGFTAGLVPVVPWVGTVRPEPSPGGLATELSEAGKEPTALTWYEPHVEGYQAPAAVDGGAGPVCGGQP